jgi:hypothetical protein
MLAAVSCKDPFEAPVSGDQVNFLVVDGTINVSDSSATVKISRAIKLSTKDQVGFESNAVVTIEEENGLVLSLPSVDKGVYQIKRNPFKLQKKYRLKILTTAGQKYSSPFIELLQTPPIDSVTWRPSKDGVSISVSSTGKANSSNYYKWNFVETWKYHAAFFSALKIVNEVISSRFPEEQVYFCWRNALSSQILIKSADAFNKNSISQFQLTILPPGSEKLDIKYSILVQQTSLTEEAYHFWDQLQKTTQNLGGLFDPLPSQVKGNIVNENNTGETVLGYFSGSSVETKRIFIANINLPEYLQAKKFVPVLECNLVNIPFSQISGRGKSLVIVGSYGQPFTVGYTFAYLECVDCRQQGGTTTEPSFWK